MSLFILSVSATVVNGTSYDWKVYQGQLNLSEHPDSSFSQSCYITVGCDDWKLSGSGRFGYDTSVSTFYVQIDKYAGANGSWVLKLDSDKYWKYRDGLNDYGTMHSTWHSMKTEPKDIYVTFGGIDLNDVNDTWWLTKTLTYSPSYTYTFTGEGISTFTHSYDRGDLATLPDYARDGYILQGWKTYDASGKEWFYEVGKTFNVTSDVTFEAVWTKPKHVIKFIDDTAAMFTVTVEHGDTFTYPDPKGTGYYFVGWQDINTGEIYEFRRASSPVTSSATYKAVWKSENEVYTLNFHSYDNNLIETILTDKDYYYAPPMSSPDGMSFAGYKIVESGVSFTDPEESGFYKFSFDGVDLGSTLNIVPLAGYSIGFSGEGFENFYYNVIPGEYFIFPEAPAVSGKVFRGWTKLIDSMNVLYRPGMPSLPVTQGDVYVAVYDYASGDPVYIVTFTGDGVEEYSISVIGGEEITIPGALQREGYEFKCWSRGVPYKDNYPGDKVVVNGDMTFTAVWSPWANREVSFKGKGFDTFTLLTDEKGCITLPELNMAIVSDSVKDNYVFKGWNDGKRIIKPGEIYNCVIEENYTLTAEWELKEGGSSTFLGIFFEELFALLRDAFFPLLSYELPLVGIAVGDVVEFFFSLIVIFIIFKIVGPFIK